jgi:diguanylate cyclase (GGDEF)-like protein/putative nucleotidyltransferase with HDIG domain
LVFTALYFLLNSWLVAFALGFETQRSPIPIWWTNFTWLSVNYFSGASVAALIVTYTPGLDLSTLVVIVPLLVVSYLTFRTAMGRVEDSNNHLSELNKLYLSTIETLAMAIDAKDQITHGHIRRVQAYAVGLARSSGVADEKLIKAIEAAALLHDMGKLAVPEYILNKPGKLTVAEFEKMKLHATVGADILSAIDFPYPVVPIVRHHHENWDGSGYPTGLKGPEIPIGARILSVVDCFDALTSDRPYRPRLPDAEAIRILLERRGSMYDPLIVDTFIRVYRDIAPSVAPPEPRRYPHEIAGLMKKPSGTVPEVPRLDEIAASADEMLTLYELAGALAGQGNTTGAFEVIANQLRRLVPSSLSVLFLYETASDELEARHAIGEWSSLVKGLRVPRGQRLSGWVAANRQTIMNSDPTLDFGDLARGPGIRLRSCLSTPLVSGEQLVGVLTLYSEVADAFSEDHRRIIEAVGRQVAQAFESAIERTGTTEEDVLTRLPNVRQLEHILDSGAIERATLTLLFIEVVGLRELGSQDGLKIADEAMRHVVRCAREVLRNTDILIRYGNDELCALLIDTDQQTARTLAISFQRAIRNRALVLKQGKALTIETVATCVAPPSNAQSLRDLVTVAHAHMWAVRAQSPPLVH